MKIKLNHNIAVFNHSILIFTFILFLWRRHIDLLFISKKIKKEKILILIFNK